MIKIGDVTGNVSALVADREYEVGTDSIRAVVFSKQVVKFLVDPKSENPQSFISAISKGFRGGVKPLENRRRMVEVKTPGSYRLLGCYERGLLVIKTFVNKTYDGYPNLCD